MKVTAAGTPTARSRHEICEAVRLVNCGHCWARPGAPCTSGETAVNGLHVARFARAMRRGLIAGPELIAVLQALVKFTPGTVICDVTDGAR
jgi:hypothetical protein